MGLLGCCGLELVVCNVEEMGEIRSRHTFLLPWFARLTKDIDQEVGFHSTTTNDTSDLAFLKTPPFPVSLSCHPVNLNIHCLRFHLLEAI